MLPRSSKKGAAPRLLGVALLFVVGGPLLLARPARAQLTGTTFSLRAVPGATSVGVGDTFTIQFFLDVMAAGSVLAPPFDEYLSTRGYLVYAQDAAGGAAPPSPFSLTPTVTNNPGTNTGAGQSGFANSVTANGAVAATEAGVADYLGISFNLNNGTTYRSDSGTFLLSSATASFSSAGTYTFRFEEVPGTAGRTLVTGRTNDGAGNTTTFTATADNGGVQTSGFTVNVFAVPEPGTVSLALAPGGLLLILGLRRRQRRRQRGLLFAA